MCIRDRVVSGAIIIMAFELVKSSVEKMIHPENVEYSTLAMVILVVSIGVKLYMCFYNRAIGKKLDSAAMRATAMDSLSDTCATFVVLILSLIHISHWLCARHYGICFQRRRNYLTVPVLCRNPGYHDYSGRFRRFSGRSHQ